MAFGSVSKMLQKMLPPHSSKAIETPKLDAKDDPWHRPFVLQQLPALMPQRPRAVLRHDSGHKTLVLTPRPNNQAILSATIDGLIDLQDEQEVLDSFDRAVFVDPAQNLALPSRVVTRSCRNRPSSPAPSSVYSRLADAVPGKSLRDRVDSGVVASTSVASRKDDVQNYSHTSERRCANRAFRADGKAAVDSAVDSLQGRKSVSGSQQIEVPCHERSDHDRRYKARRPTLHVEIPVEDVAAALRPITFDSAMDAQESLASASPQNLAHLESRFYRLRKTSNRTRTGHPQKASKYDDSTRCVQPLDEAAALIKEIRYMLGLPVADLVKHCIHPALRGDASESAAMAGYAERTTPAEEQGRPQIKAIADIRTRLNSQPSRLPISIVRSRTVSKASTVSTTTTVKVSTTQRTVPDTRLPIACSEMPFRSSIPCIPKRSPERPTWW